MNFKMIATAAALLAAGTANAAITSWNGGSSGAGNGSVVLVMLDSTGTQTYGLTVDLGYNYLDFISGGSLNTAGTTVSWDFSANTITVNGVLVTGVTNDWASQLAIFSANSSASESKWAVVSGSQSGTSVTGFLATGTPTASQLTQQNASGTSSMNSVDGTNAVNSLIQSLTSGNKGTIVSADNGAYAMASTDTSYVGTDYSLTTVNGFKNNIKWNTWNSILGTTTTGFTQLNANGTEVSLGTWVFSGTTLTYSVAAAIPEPTSLALALAGVAGLVVARRRAAK